LETKLLNVIKELSRFSLTGNFEYITNDDLKFFLGQQFVYETNLFRKPG